MACTATHKHPPNNAKREVTCSSLKSWPALGAMMALLDQSGLRTLRRLHTHYSCFGHAVSIRMECGSISQKPATDSTQTFCLFDLGRPGHGRAQCCCFSELEHLACHLQLEHVACHLHNCSPSQTKKGIDSPTASYVLFPCQKIICTRPKKMMILTFILQVSVEEV